MYESMRIWGMTAAFGALLVVAGAGLGLIPGFQLAGALIPLGTLIWWAVGEFSPRVDRDQVG